MRVNDYYITWLYTDKIVLDKKNKEHTCVNTSCIITKDERVISIGNTRCSIKDRDIKEIGRKLSLQRAINDFNKSIRTDFWESYRTMTKTPKW